MTRTFQWIATAFGVALVLWAGWWLRGCAIPEVPAPEVVYVDREITRRDTVTVDRPTTRTIYERTTDTVFVRVATPRGFTPHGLISASPVRIDGSRVTLSYFDHQNLQWRQDVYEVEGRWGLMLDTGIGCGPLECAIDARLTGRYKRVSGYAGYAVGQVSHGPIWGVRVRLF